MTVKKSESKISGAMIEILFFLMMISYGNENVGLAWRLKPGDVINVEGATIIFDAPEK